MYNAENEKSANIIGERIREAREQKRWTQTQFSTLLQQFGIHVTKATVGKWELGRYLPNAYQFLAVCHALEIADIGQYFSSLPQELNAVGLQKLAEYRSDLIATGRYGAKRRPAGVRMIEMPVSYQAVSAGTGEFLDEGSFEMVSVPEDSVPYGADAGIRIHGDSMEPDYHEDQIVWVHWCETLRPGEVGVFTYDGNGYVKVYDEELPAADDAEMLTGADGVLRKRPVLRSLNPAYEPIRVSPSALFTIAGRVLN